MLLRGSLELGDVDVTLRVGTDDDDLVPNHRGGRRVGTVRGHWDDADVAVVIAAGLVVRANRHQARVFTRSSAVGLEGHGVERGDLAELLGQFVEHLAVPRGLLLGREGVHVCELRPGDGDHLGCGVELHRARPERDHRVHQGQILGLEPREVADHLVLGVVRVEHRVREVPGLASEEIGRVHGRRQGFGGETGSRSAVERGEERVDVRHRGGLVEREAHGVGVELADVHAVCLAVRDGLVRAVRAAERDGVEKRVGGFRKANLGGALGEDGGEAVGLVGDRLEPGRSVVDGVEPRHVREERLRGADVGGCLIAADVLLTGLHRHAERGRALGVDGHADDAAGHEPLVVLGGCEVPGVGPAEAHGNAEALRGSDADVGAPLAGRHEGGEREEIGGGDNLGARRVSRLDDGGVVNDGAVGGGVLEEHAADVVAGVVEAVLIADDDGESESVGARLAHLDRLRVALVRDEKLGLLPAVHRAAHRHRLRGGGTLIEERRVGHGKRGEVADHGLVVEQRLQSALRDLRLVRGVLGVPSRVLEDVA
mmetsp:Transcript_2524/g.11435  ORF Transcript_2524/g.11435 Transcript_2524/m.11435 type:complete len:541 (+) Transcript_2524:1032-2654(+)